MIELTGHHTYTLHLDEDYAMKVWRAVADTLHQFDTADPRYVELVNKGHIDTLCVLKNVFSREFK